MDHCTRIVESRIPKRLHYVWVGSSLPDKQRRLIDGWRDLHRDFEVVGWNESNIDMDNPLIKSAYARRRWATVADVVRLSAVYEYGGIYLDTDIRVHRSLDQLLQYNCFFAFQHENHPTDWIANCVFGAVPKHPVIAIAWKKIMRLKPSWLGLDRPTKYGPKLFTRVLRDSWGVDHYSANGVTIGDVFVCPTTYFFPFSYTDEADEGSVRPDTLATHMWEQSWATNLPAAIRWKRALREALSRK
jgi:hypothetical protein